MGAAKGVEAPKQARSRRSYHRILEATAELLADRSFEAVTIDEIVERAGYTKGAFYARFRSKAALLRHLVARLTDGAVDAWDAFLDPAGWEGTPVAELVERFVRRMAAIHTGSGHVMRVIDREVRLGGDPEVRATAERLNRHVADGFIRLMEGRRSELRAEVRSDVRATCEYWLMALRAVLRDGLLYPDAEVAGDGTDPVADRTVALMVPYLVGD